MIDANEYLKNNSGIVNKLANKYFMETPKFSYEDLVAVGNVAALNALKAYNPNNETKVSTYVHRAIQNEMRRFVSKNKYDINVTLGQQERIYEAHKNGQLSDSKAENATALRIDWDTDDNQYENSLPSGEMPPIEKLMVKETYCILEEELDALPTREKNIIRARFYEGKCLEEIAKEQSCSKQRIHQIQNRAMDKLRVNITKRLS